ncbi:MAG: serine/threonine-protein kinase [Acidobacteriota bacterium]
MTTSGSPSSSIRQAIGREVAGYRLHSLLGRGGMSQVWKAQDLERQRWVAIKRLRPKITDAKAVRRLRREAKTTGALDHPAIVQIFDLLSVEGDDWLVMELIQGVDVAVMLVEKPIPPRRALELGRQVAVALASAHAHNILHRDLKAENVMVEPCGRARLLDFGLAKRLDVGDESALTRSGEVMGTCRSMSPEQANGESLDARSDLFSLGTLLYEMTTGESPFDAATPVATLHRVVKHRQDPVRRLDPTIPAEVSHLIDHLLAKNRDDRPAGAADVATRIEGIQERLDAGGGWWRRVADRFSSDRESR